MSLVFEYVKDLDTGQQPFIGHEADSTLYNYFLDGEIAKDRNILVPLGQYDNVVFSNEERHLTTRAVSRIGVKNFPGIGGIGFYRDAYSDTSLIAAPIHTDKDKQKAPTLTTAEIVGNKLHIVITPPEDLEYGCYRVVVKQSYFAFEYITYKTECFVDMPTVKGNYSVFCMGYDEDNGRVSEDSNAIGIVISTGADNWMPHMDDLVGLDARLETLEGYVIGSGEVSPFALNAYSIFNGDNSTSTTSASASVSTEGEDVTLYALVLTRSTPTFPTGWEVVQQFDATYYGSDTTRQTLTILKKIPTEGSTSETFSVSVATAGRIYITLLNLSGVSKLVVNENRYSTNSSAETAGYTTTLTKSENNALYIFQTITTSTAAGQVMGISPSDNCIVIMCGNRMAVVVDMSTNNSHVLTHSYTSNTGVQWVSLNIKEATPSDGLLTRVNTLESTVSELEDTIGDIDTVLDEITKAEV